MEDKERIESKENINKGITETKEKSTESIEEKEQEKEKPEETEEKEETKEQEEGKPEEKESEEKEKIIKKRKLFKFNKEKFNFKNKKFWLNIFFIVVLLAIIFLGVWIRTQNIPQLKDVTTGNYTLGPDLDPFLYLRHAHEIVEHRLQNPDMMRAAPRGSTNYAKTNLMPWAIVFIYKFFRLGSVEFAAIIAPLIFFGLTLIVFFFFIKKLFSFTMDKRKAIIVALIATAFYAVVPAMLHRTTAGIPEIESLGMLWFWSAFLCFISAWQSKKIKKIILFGILAGIFTGLMIFTWGGYRYIFMTFTLASFLAFLFNKEKRKNFLIFILWLIPSLIFAFAKKPGLGSLIVITDTGLASMVLFILLVDLVIFNTKLKKIKEKIKLPESIISLIIGLIILISALLIFNPSYIAHSASRIIDRLINPFGTGRISLTVAENRAPYFVEVFRSFSWLFWIFFFGSLSIFYEATKHFNKKNKTLLNFFFVIFMITFIFSRISPQSLLNGENFISKFLYFGGLIVFILILLGIYIKSYVKKDEKTLKDFKNINFSYILALSFIFWMIISMRGGVRLFFIISPAIIMGASFLPIKLTEYSLKVKDNLSKIILWCAIILVVFLLILTFINYTKTTSQEAKYTIPGPYYQQWQKAMAWVRNNTPKGAIFAHWWDYGYWVQTLGERPTILDGGHPMHHGFWNYLMGRHVLCGQNETEALEFLYAHNASYLLIDSSDIGKYSAYSSIGSDKTGKDRISWINTFVLDEKKTQETRNETSYVYTGGTMLDQDLIWKDNLFPMQKAGIAAFILTINKNNSIKDLEAIVFYNNKQFKVPLNYIYFNGHIYKINDKGIEGMLYIIPKVTNNGINNLGAALYLSKKVMNSEMAKLYLLNESENFELAHKEDALFVQQLRDAYNVSVGDFIYARGLYGPIKIWKINYPENFTVPEKKLKRYLQFNSDLPFKLW